MVASFKTNPVQLEELLKDCNLGKLQLPDFQRSWVWDEERIRSLIASISQAFPVGALMTLEKGGEVDFKPRAVQGAPDAAKARAPDFLLLDGQQRMTSLFQTTLRRAVVETVTVRKTKVKHWYYLGISAALDPQVSREDAVIGVPEDRVVRSNFARDVDLDLSTLERECAEMMFPVNRVFDWDDWQDGFFEYWPDKDSDQRKAWKLFKDNVLQNFKHYQVPVIALDKETSKEAVCLVFEKVNTGGKALDAFELVTAMYAARNFELRADWYGKEGDADLARRLGRSGRLKQHGVLANVGPTDLLQTISLLHTKAVRDLAIADGKQGRELPQVSASRPSLLSIPLEAYQAYADRVEAGFVEAAKFLRSQRIYRVLDLPYQSQIVPLAAILAELGPKFEYDANRLKVTQWYWNGVFGEMYGSAVESRFARDLLEVPAWVGGGPEPSTVTTATVRADRLRTMRSRLSAAYKGINALLMQVGAKDFRSGQAFDQTIFFNENVDIHHIFPRDWCEKQGIPGSQYDAIVNKTPLTARTNRILGGVAPTAYLERLEQGSAEAPPIDSARLDELLRSHLIDPALIRADDFAAFMDARQEALLRLIEQAIGRPAYREGRTNEPEEDVAEGDDAEPASAAELALHE